MRNQHENESLSRPLLASASSLVNLYRPPGAPRIHFDESTAGGGAAAGGADAAAAAAAAGAGGSQQKDPASGPSSAGGQSSAAAAATPHRPEGLPDHLLGKDDKETVDKVFKAYDGFRKTAGEQGAVPESADKYSFEASDKLKPHVANFDKDPVYIAARDLAHKSGMTDKVFKSFIPSLLEHLVDGGLVEAPMDPKAMLRQLAPVNMDKATDAEKEVAGGKRVRDNIAWLDQMKADKTLPDDAATYLVAQAADNPGAHALIDWLRGNRQERKPALTGGAAAGGSSKADLDARTADPRNDPQSPKFEKAFAERTREMFKEAHP